jgi:competence protein ComEC
MLPSIPSEFREIDVLLWSGKDVSRSWFKQLNIESAIAVTNKISDNLKQEMNQDQLNIYITGKDGAIQWTPTGGLETRLNQF